MLNKKGQGLGGLLMVLVVGLFFLSTFPLLQGVMEAIISDNNGVIAGMLYLVIFLPVFFFAKFAYNLGA